MRQFDWDFGCPDIWFNMVLNLSGGCFQEKLAFELVNSVKKIALLKTGGLPPICWRLD